MDVEIRSIPLIELIEQCGDDLLLIKIDIEGGEEELIEVLLNESRSRKLCLHLSFHLPWWQNKDLSRFKDALGEHYTPVEALLREKPFSAVFFDFR